MNDTGKLRHCVDSIAKLVAFPTVSRESNLELIDYVRTTLERFGAQVRLTFDDERRKANLFATLGPAGPGGLVLSGHTDVVPVEGQDWASDPFAMREEGGRLYGRGTSDMKGFIAIALALLPEFAPRLNRPLHLALSYDEEVGCIGVGRLIDDLARAGIKPDGCVVGEPTLMTPVIAHKGKKAWRCHVRGRAAHSAYAPKAVNAVEAAAEAVAYLKAMARRLRDHGPYDHAFDIVHTTVHTGVMRGGTALNIVPHEASFDFEVRHLPGDDPLALLAELETHIATRIAPEMQAIDSNAGFEIVEMSEIPALDTSAETAIVALVHELTGTSEVGKVSYGTEASQFQRAGIPSVVCGPGSIEQAHKPNEYIELAQVETCERFLRKLMERLT
ncbi:MAG TPA: acetylornithine deacetylase [Burkholderiales bacterium]|nr:acetylornithine deacetylase [Burkholderiales bacterium]